LDERCGKWGKQPFAWFATRSIDWGGPALRSEGANGLPGAHFEFRRTKGRRFRAAKVIVAALLFFVSLSSLHAFPDYLAYSNEIAGGPSHTYRLVANSNADWGQGLK
jgi:hypothetical protein